MQSMATNIFSAYASVAASVMLFRSVVNDMIPESVKLAVLSVLTRFFKHFLGRFFNLLSADVTLVVDEKSGITRNEIYDAAEIYLGTIDDPDTDRYKVNKNSKEKSIRLCLEKNQKAVDFFRGFQITWEFVLVEPENNRHTYYNPDKRYFELRFEKSRKDEVINGYLPLVLAKAKEIKEKDKSVKLYTRDFPFQDDDDYSETGRGGSWGGVNLDHPTTFDKLAMDPCLKQSIIDDLDRFVRRKDYYKKVGKAWKRGYLLYGPPGTGKSSLIAAMANYLKFDVYDLELTSLRSNSDLKITLLSTTNRSIVVIEDIDCTVQILDREAEVKNENSPDTKLTLSGLLNFIDGLWSTCGDERIIIFTTNYKEKLDPALLRPGRMDMHIHMGYCTPEGFDVLVMNYLEGMEDLSKAPFPEIKELIKEVDISPAEIAERLMRSDNADAALEGVIDLLKKKKEEKISILETVLGETKSVGIDIGKKRNLGRVMKSLTKFRRRSIRR